MKVDKTTETSYHFTKKDIEDLLVNEVVRITKGVNGKVNVYFDIQESQDGGLAGDYIPTNLRKATVKITKNE